MLAADFHFLQLAECAQPHVEDGLGLVVGEREARDERRLRLVFLADDADHLVEVEVGNQIALEDFEAPRDFAQAEVGAANQHVLAVVQPLAQHLAEAHHLRHLAVAQHVHVERDAGFELGVAEHLFHHQRRVDGAALRLQHDAHVLGRFIAHVGEQWQLLGGQELGDLLDQAALLHEIGNFGDHDLPGAARQFLHAPAGAHAEAAAAGPVGFEDRGAVVDDDAARREIRSLHQLADLLIGRIRRLDEVQRGVTEFGRVVRRDRGCHADGDAGGTIGQQVREGAGQHHGLLHGAIIVGAEVDRVLVEALEQELRHLRHAGFGVAVGGGTVAVDVAEVALPVDQRIARGEVLREADERVIDRLVAMRMIAAHHVADDLGGLLEGRVRIEPEDLHHVQQAAVHRLQPVAHIGQRTVHDGGQRIGQVALFQRFLEVDLLDVLGAFGRGNVLAHDSRFIAFPAWGFGCGAV